MTFDLNNNQFIGVLYHYIRDGGNYRFEKIYHCPFEKFSKQLDFLEKNYKIVDPSTLLEKLNGPEDSNKYCCLTFDDGLIEHYELVYPEFKKRGLTGVFSPITVTLEGKLPLTHKMHILLSRMESRELVELYHVFMKEFYPELLIKYEIHDRFKIKPARRFDDVLTANLKEVMAILPEEVKESYISHLFGEKIKLDEAQICRELFLSAEQIREMSQGGMIISGHSHSHSSLKSQSYERQKWEISACRKILESITDRPLNVFSYPFGDYNEDTLKIMAEENFQAAFATQGKVISKPFNKYVLYRLDTNEIPAS